MLHYSKILAIATVLAVVPWVNADEIIVKLPAKGSTHCIGKPIKIACDVPSNGLAEIRSLEVSFVSVNDKTRRYNISNSKRPSDTGLWKYSKNWHAPSSLTPGDYQIKFKGKAVVLKVPGPGEEHLDIDRAQRIKLVKC